MDYGLTGRPTSHPDQKQSGKKQTLLQNVLHSTWAWVHKPSLLNQSQRYWVKLLNGGTGLDVAHIWPAGSRIILRLGSKEQSGKLTWTLLALRGVEGCDGSISCRIGSLNSEKFLWISVWSPRGPEDSRESYSLRASKGIREVQEILTVLPISFIVSVRHFYP